jgi:hypothetical protein
MRYVTIVFLVLLAVVHQDYWWWDSRQTLFGFLPIGLAWHVAISILAGFGWYLATRYCWPEDLRSSEEELGELHVPAAKE